VRIDLFNKVIPLDISKEQEEQLQEVLINNALRFYQAGGFLTLDVWCELTTESQNALIEARMRILQAMSETEVEPEVEPAHELVASPEKPEVPAQS
jgi:hypothetical protein